MILTEPKSTVIQFFSILVLHLQCYILDFVTFFKVLCISLL